MHNDDYKKNAYKLVEGFKKAGGAKKVADSTLKVMDARN